MDVIEIAPTRSCAIVLVDDDPLIGDLASAILAAAGHSVAIVDHGDDAIEEIWRRQPDLVILDCGLPGRSGMMILSDIRGSTAFAALPVLVMTGRRSEFNEKIAFDRGADGYLRKPFAPGALVDEVARLTRPGAVDGRALP